MKTFDFIGLKCPIPVLKAHKIIKASSENAELEFLSDDPTAPQDFESLCNNMKSLKLDIIKDKEFDRIRIKKV